MKKKIAIILLLLISVAIGVCWAQQDDYKEGDILFQVSKSRQSPLIQKATGSKWSHCGVVVEKDKKLYVLEASKVVRLTPLQQWIKQGKDEKVKMMRVKKDPVKIKYNKYLGKSYDLAFKFDNGKWYCSERGTWVLFTHHCMGWISKQTRVGKYLLFRTCLQSQRGSNGISRILA